MPDFLAEALRGLPCPPPGPQDVAETAALLGWLPDPGDPWCRPASLPGRPAGEE